MSIGCSPADLTLIVPVRDDAVRLSACLSSLRRQRGGESVAVIVADNGSRDHSVEVAQGHGATCLLLPGRSVAQLRNLAVAAATTPLVAMVDADHILWDGWLDACLDLMGDETVTAGGAPCFAPAPGTWVQRAYDRFRLRSVDRADVEWLGSGNLVIRRAAFADLGGFDESLETCEDVDLCNRLRQRGARLVAEPGMRNTHIGDPATLRQLFLGELWRGRDNLRVTLRGPWTLRALPSLLIPVFLALAVLTSAVGLVGGLLQPGLLWLALTGPAALLMSSFVRVVRMAANGARPLLVHVPAWGLVAGVYELARALALVTRASHEARRTEKGPSR